MVFINLFNLFAKLTLDTSDYYKNIEEAKKSTDNFAQKTLNSIKVISANAWVQLAQVILNAGKAIANATLDLVDYADKYDDLSAKYDISTKSLQEFEYIASQNGTTLEALLSTMTMMYNRAKEGDEVFDKLGISVKDVNGNMKSMDELFWETKTAIDQVSNSGDQSALMLEAFGRNAMEVGEVLRRDTLELKEMADMANELGIVLEEGVTAKAGAVNDTLAELKLRGKTAFTELLFGTEGAEEKLEDYIDTIMDLMDKNLPTLLKGFTRILEIVIKRLAEALPDLIPILIDSFFSVNWIEVGWNIAKAIFKGIASIFSQGLPALLGFGKNEANEINYTTPTDIDIMPTDSYEVNQNVNQKLDINITATGDTEISDENANLIAEHLIPYIDQKLGEV